MDNDKCAEKKNYICSICGKTCWSMSDYVEHVAECSKKYVKEEEEKKEKKILDDKIDKALEKTAEAMKAYGQAYDEFAKLMTESISKYGLESLLETTERCLKCDENNISIDFSDFLK